MPKVEMVKSDAIIDIKIGSKFLQDLQATLLYLTTLEPTSKIQETVDKVKADGNTDGLTDWEKSLYTLLVLITNLEENARAAGLTVTEDVQDSDSLLQSLE